MAMVRSSVLQPKSFIKNKGKSFRHLASLHDIMNINKTGITLGMRNNVLPIGFAIKKEDRYNESWSYNIIPERLIAYNHGKINEVQVQNIEKNLNTIISQFEEMKRDLVFLLKENEELEG